MGTMSHGKAFCEVDWVVVQEVLDLDDLRVHNHTNRECLDLWPGAALEQKDVSCLCLKIANGMHL